MCLCAPAVCVYALLFHLGRENCRQLNHKRSTDSTNQVRVERYFPDLQYMALIVYSSKERLKKFGRNRKHQKSGREKVNRRANVRNEKGGRFFLKRTKKRMFNNETHREQRCCFLTNHNPLHFKILYNY